MTAAGQRIKYKNLNEKLQEINAKWGNSFNCKTFINKFEYECSAGNEIFFCCNAR